MKPHISKSSRAAAQKAKSRQPVMKRSRPKAERAPMRLLIAAIREGSRYRRPELSTRNDLVLSGACSQPSGIRGADFNRPVAIPLQAAPELPGRRGSALRREITVSPGCWHGAAAAWTLDLLSAATKYPRRDSCRPSDWGVSTTTMKPLFRGGASAMDQYGIARRRLHALRRSDASGE